MLRWSARRFTRQIRIGDAASERRIFDDRALATFGQLVGDTNPIHSNADAAKKAGFKERPVVYGMLVASMISKIMGNELPGPQSIYMQQTLTFKAPVYQDEEVEAEVKVTNFDEQRGFIWLETTVRKMDGTVVIKGQALGKNKVVEYIRDAVAEERAQ